MKKEKNNKKVKEAKIRLAVQYNSAYIGHLIVLTIMAILITVANIIFKDESVNAWAIVFDALFGAIALIAFIMFLLRFQIARVDKKGITIRCLLYKIKYIKWNEVCKITEAQLCRKEGKSDVSRNWLVIYTDEEQKSKKGGSNKRKKGPWQVKDSKKNHKYLYEFWEKYKESQSPENIKNTFLEKVKANEKVSFMYKDEKYGVSFNGRGWIYIYKTLEEENKMLGSFRNYDDFIDNCKIDESFLRDILEAIIIID